jgi:hypothetical protein
LDENFHDIIAWIRNMWQSMQTGARLGVVDGSIDELHLWSNKIINHEGYCEHQHFHAIASHLCIFLGVALARLAMIATVTARKSAGHRVIIALRGTGLCNMPK